MTKTWHEATRDAWRTLQLGGGATEFAVATVRLSLDAGLGPVRFALSLDGSPQILIPTEPGRRLPDGLSGPGIAVRSVQYVVGNEVRPFIEVSSGSRSLDDVFVSLTDEVLRRLEAGSGAELAVAQSISEFRELLSRGHSQSLEALVGLFGELDFLNNLLRKDSSAASNWTGPLRQRFDFSGRQQYVEIKTSLQRTGTRIFVNAIDQLDPPDDGLPLALVHTVLERTGTAGQSVRDLIQKSFDLSASVDVLEQALGQLAVSDWRTNSSLAKERFRVLRRTFYAITSEFPRLTKQSFKDGHPVAGISDISYTMDLTHAAGFRLDTSQELRVCQGILTVI